jgi:hypothetical protein
MRGKRRRKKKEAPSVKGLIKLRGELTEVMRSLAEADARPQDAVGRRRIQESILEVTRRRQRLRNVLDKLVSLKAKRTAYEQRIQKIDKRVDTMIGRQFRGNQGRLRKWKAL